jgi:hypothetical protein
MQMRNSFKGICLLISKQTVIIGIVLVLLLLPSTVHAQGPYADFYRESLRINNIGMAILGTWALTNISIGAYGWNQQTGQRAYFHQMNLFWNTVNLTIAGIALYGNLTSDYGLLTGSELLDKQLKAQHLYLINGALDVGYIAAGSVLRYIAPRYPKNELRLSGYGNSVILQGSFLLVFDLVFYGLQRSHRTGFLDQLSVVPMHDAWGMILSFHF